MLECVRDDIMSIMSIIETGVLSFTECVASHYKEDLIIQRSKGEILNVDVDGRLMTHVHTSKMSGGLVIEADTGLILDHECLSKYCQN